MPSTDDVIKRLIWQFSSTGADKVAADLNRVTTGQDKLAVSSEQTTKASLSLEKSFDALERRFDSTIRAQQDYEKVQQKVNAAVAQNPQLQERANNVLELAKAKFEGAGSSGSAFSKIVDTGRDSLLGFAAQGGPVGALLGSFGPWGVAAAAGIGLVTSAMNALQEGAAKMGETSNSLKQFADNTGLTITQVRGLSNAGGELGVSSDTVSSAIQKFTLNLDAARKGTGDLYDRLNAFDSGLADQVATTRDSAQALDILAKAYNSTADAVTKAAIARAAFGKGGAAAGGILGVTDAAGGVNAYSEAVQKALGITDEWTKKTAEASNRIKSLTEDLDQIKRSIYTEEMQAKAEKWLQTQIEIAKVTRESLAAVKDNDYAALFAKDFAGTTTDNIKAATDAKKADTEATKADTAATEANTAAKQVNNAALIASKSARNVAALGTAATPEERGQARIDALMATPGLDPNILSRAIQGVRDDTEKAAKSMQTYSAAADGAKNTLGDMYKTIQGTDKVLYDDSERYKQDEAAISKSAAESRKLAEEARKAQNAYNAMVFSAQAVADATDIAAENTARAAKTAQDFAYAMEKGIFAANVMKGQFTTDLDLNRISPDSGIPRSVLLSAADQADQAARAQLNKPRTFGTTGSDLVYGLLDGKRGYYTRDQLAAQSKLTDSIDNLTKSTDSLNATNQELLSPYYTQDPRTSHIGFRSQGMASGGYVDVPGGYSANDNMLATIPVASGERIYVDPMTSRRGTASGGTVINISSPINIYGNADKDQFGRTVYQANQQLAKSVRAATQ